MFFVNCFGGGYTRKMKLNINNKILVSTLIVFVALVLMFFISVFLNNYPSFRKQSKPSQVSTMHLPIKTVYKGVLPNGFPSSVLIEKSSLITQSYSKEYADATQQKSVVLTSSKTVTENFEVYKKFLNDDGWKTSAMSQTSTFSLLHGVKGGDLLEIVFRNKIVPKTMSTSTARSYIIINVFNK